MSRVLKMTLRITALMLALTLLPVVFAPSKETASPYISALSDLSATSAFALQGCKRTWCVGLTCQGHTGTTCKLKPGAGTCETILC